MIVPLILLAITAIHAIVERKIIKKMQESPSITYKNTLGFAVGYITVYLIQTHYIILALLVSAVYTLYELLRYREGKKQEVENDITAYLLGVLSALGISSVVPSV